jgi:nucleotide-binding universal stress UspA family protein
MMAAATRPPQQPRPALSRPLPRRILVATDGGSASAGAEKAGLELARRAGASLVLVTVIDPSRLRLPGGLFHTRVDQIRSARTGALSDLVDRARREGIDAQFLIWEGEPGPSVVDAAQAEQADVIVVGSHARGTVGRLLLGSISSYVVRNAGPPVVVVRADQSLDEVWPAAAG